MQYVVIDKIVNKAVSTYSAIRPLMRGVYADLITFGHYEMLPDTDWQGYFLNNGNLDYDINLVPVQPALKVAEEETKVRQLAGFAVYQKVYSDMAISGSIASLDAFLQGYPYLMQVRCLLKDGQGEACLRYLVKTILPLGLFTQEKFDLYKLWLREYAQKYRAVGTEAMTIAQYDARLDAIETEVSI